MIDGFDKIGFMHWLYEEFPSVFKGNTFAVDMAENIIDYGLKHCNHSKEQLAYFISDMIPEVEYCEVVDFCSSDISVYGSTVTE